MSGGSERAGGLKEAVMIRRLQFLLVLGLSGVCCWPWFWPQPQAQGKQVAARGNSCVACHGALQEPLPVSARFYEWQMSRHQAKEVTCDKCHGGDPALADREKAHQGIHPPADSRSRLYYRNQPETCGACHQPIVKAFTRSKHYQVLRGIGLGASCNTCHAHMATQVVTAPPETANLCARCHDIVNYMQPRPQIPAQAGETMTALQRANAVVLWTDLLLAQVEQRGLPHDLERAELQAAQARLAEAKVKWHTFELAGVRGEADAAFQQGVKAREALRKKLGIH
jgi:hypothetical protein